MDQDTPTVPRGVGETPSAPLEVVVPQPEAFKPLTVEDVSESAGRQIVQVPFEIAVPTIKDGMESDVEITLSIDRRFLYLTHGTKIEKWEFSEDFHLARLRLVRKLIDKYNFIIAGVPSEVNPFSPNSRITLPSKLGFDIISQVKRLTADDYSQLAPKLGLLQQKDVPGDLLYEDVILAATSRELELQSRLEALLLAETVPATMLHDYISHLNNFYFWLKPLPNDFSPLYTVVPFTSVSLAHEQLMAFRTPYRTLVYNTVLGWVRDTFTVRSLPMGKTFSDLLTTFEISLNRFSAVSTLPARISEGRHVEFLVNMITTVLLSRWFEMTYHVDPNRFSMETLIEILMLKIFAPKRIFSDATITKMDNYVAAYLVMRGNFYTGTLTQMDTLSSTNILARACEGIPELYEFLVTSQHGDGWASAGRASAYRTMRSANDAKFNPNSMINEAVYTDFSLDEADGDSPSLQMRRFQKFANFLSQGKATAGQRRIASIQRNATSVVDLTAVARFLDNISQRITDLGEFARRINLFISSMAWNPLCGQTTDDGVDTRLIWLDVPVSVNGKANMSAADTALRLNESKKTVIRSEIQITPMSAVALPLAVEPGSVDTYGSQIPNLFKAFSWFNSLHDLTGNYALTRTYLPAPYFRTPDRVASALSMMTTFLKEPLTQALVDTKMFIVPPAGSQLMINRAACVETFLSGNEHLHGFTSEVVFNGQMIDPPAYAKILTSCDTGVSVTYSIEDLISLYQTEKLAQTTSDSVKTGSALGFAIPTRIKLVDATPSIDSTPAFSFMGPRLKSGEVTVALRWADDALREVLATNEYAFWRPPAFMTPRLPFVPITSMDLLKLVKSVRKRARLILFGVPGTESAFVMQPRV